MKLSIQVTNGLELDAGTLTENGDEYIIYPPEKTLFDQLWDWLQDHPLNQNYPTLGIELGIGATALCFRWGTYFAVLADENKPIDPRAIQQEDSMISNDEMMRINIEFSSNLERLLERLHGSESTTMKLLQRAYHWLPMPQRRVYSNLTKFLPAALIQQTITMDLPRIESINELYQNISIRPYRALANAITSLIYRNGPIEDIHAGENAAYSLTHRRVTANQHRLIVRKTAEYMKPIITGIYPWDHPSVDWPASLSNLPYLMFYPRSWSFSDQSSNIVLKKELSR